MTEINITYKMVREIRTVRKVNAVKRGKIEITVFCWDNLVKELKIYICNNNNNNSYTDTNMVFALKSVKIVENCAKR